MKKWSKIWWNFKGRKKIGEESKSSFPIFKSAKDVESNNENQNHCEKTVELSSEINIQKTATHPYDVVKYRAKSLEGLKIFRNVSLLIEFTSLLKTINSESEMLVGQEESLTQNGWKNLVG